MKVEEFDVKQAEKELKNCPEIVQDYVILLKKQSENWRDISQKAINKLKNRNHESKN